MPRLLGILLVLLAGIGLAQWLSRQNQSNNGRDNKTYRPRRPSPFTSKNEDTNNSTATEDIYVMSRQSANTLCDALTGAKIDTHNQVWRCVNCQSLYHHSSVAALESDNRGACVQCSSTRRCRVSFVDD